MQLTLEDIKDILDVKCNPWRIDKFKFMDDCSDVDKTIECVSLIKI